MTSKGEWWNPLLLPCRHKFGQGNTSSPAISTVLSLTRPLRTPVTLPRSPTLTPWWQVEEGTQCNLFSCTTDTPIEIMKSVRRQLCKYRRRGAETTDSTSSSEGHLHPIPSSCWLQSRRTPPREERPRSLLPGILVFSFGGTWSRKCILLIRR